MKNTWKNVVDYIGTSRLVVIGFLLVLMISVFPLGINPGMIYSDCIVRIGMNGFLVLAMMISIVCGAGLTLVFRLEFCVVYLADQSPYSLTGVVWAAFGEHVLCLYR